MIALINDYKNSGVLYWLIIVHHLQKKLYLFRNLFYYFFMEIDLKKLPNDIAKTHKIICEQQEKIGAQQKIIDEIRQQYESLQHQLRGLLRNHYGQRSEQGMPGQGVLFADQPFPDDKESPLRVMMFYINPNEKSLPLLRLRAWRMHDVNFMRWHSNQRKREARMKL